MTIYEDYAVNVLKYHLKAFFHPLTPTHARASRMAYDHIGLEGFFFSICMVKRNLEKKPSNMAIDLRNKTLILAISSLNLFK